MYLLTLLAFYFHQIFELTDGVYQHVEYHLAHLMDLLLNPDNYEVAATKKV
jgi:hypothetical protein